MTLWSYSMVEDRYLIESYLFMTFFWDLAKMVKFHEICQKWSKFDDFGKVPKMVKKGVYKNDVFDYFFGRVPYDRNQAYTGAWLRRFWWTNAGSVTRYPSRPFTFGPRPPRSQCLLYIPTTLKTAFWLTLLRRRRGRSVWIWINAFNAGSVFLARRKNVHDEAFI